MSQRIAHPQSPLSNAVPAWRWTASRPMSFCTTHRVHAEERCAEAGLLMQKAQTTEHLQPSVQGLRVMRLSPWAGSLQAAGAVCAASNVALAPAQLGDEAAATLGGATRCAGT